MDALKEFFRLLVEFVSTGRLKAALINSTLTVFVQLFAAACYYLVFLFVLAFLGVGRSFLLALALATIHSLVAIVMVRMSFFLVFMISPLYNPTVVYPDTRFFLKPLTVARLFPLLYALPFSADVCLVALVATGAGTPWLWLVPAVILAVDAIYLLSYLFFLKPIRAASERYAREHASEILVYFAGALNTEYQMEQWVPIFQELQKSYRLTVIFANAHFMSYGAGLPIPAIRIARIRRLMSFVDSGKVKLVFYLNNASANSNLLILRNYIHIHINHGDSDKAANAANTARDYNYVFIAGRASLDRYMQINWDPARLKLVGRPQLEVLQKAARRRQRQEKKTVLYAPTFEGNKDIDCYSSLTAMGVSIVRSLLESNKYRLMVKLHPYTGVFLDDYVRVKEKIKRLVLENAHRGHRWVEQINADVTLYDLFAESDLVISDVSSVAIDFLSLDRPIIATNPFGISVEEGEKRFPFWRASHVLLPGQDVLTVVDEALAGDARRSVRRELARYYLGDNVFEPEGMVTGFCRVVDQLMDEARGS